MTQVLQVSRQGDVVTWTLDDPASRNALTGNDMVPQIIAACAAIRDDDTVKVVIVTGAGPAFSSGGNLDVMRGQFHSAKRAADVRDDYRDGIQRMVLAIHQLEIPLIAAVNGAAMGAGCDLACLCDVRVASDKAKFASSFVKLGLIAGDGGAWALPRVVGNARAAEMAFTGDPVDAQTALAWGLVSRVVAPELLVPAAQELAARMATNPARALRMTKRLLREAGTARLDTILEMSAGMQALLHQTADHETLVAQLGERGIGKSKDAGMTGAGAR